MCLVLNRSFLCTLLHTGLLVDIFGDYKYLFLMCGSVITTGGLFLFVMNIYNYHMLKKEQTAKDRKQNHKTMENQDHVEMLQIPEAATEVTEPEAKESNRAQRDPCPENTETPI